MLADDLQEVSVRVTVVEEERQLDEVAEAKLSQETSPLCLLVAKVKTVVVKSALTDGHHLAIAASIGDEVNETLKNVVLFPLLEDF